MPSFDVVSELDMHELNNAIDQTNREVSTRFDFKDSGAKIEINKEKITLTAPTEFQLQQLRDIFNGKLAKRQIDFRNVEEKPMSINLNEAKQEVTLKKGIQQEQAKKIVKLIKDRELKVQASIQGEQIRVTGKKKDDLQEVMTFLRGAKIELPLQFINFRD